MNCFSAVRKDKSGIWQCLLVAAPVIFNGYIQTVKERSPSPDGRTIDALCFNAEYLLLQFNSSQVKNSVDNRIKAILARDSSVCRQLSDQIGGRLSLSFVEWPGDLLCSVFDPSVDKEH